MPGVFGDALPFYPGPDGAQPPGGLLGLLLQAMQRQGLELPDSAPQANAAPAGNPNRFGNSKIGFDGASGSPKPHALQVAQQQYQAYLASLQQPPPPVTQLQQLGPPAPGPAAAPSVGVTEQNGLVANSSPVANQQRPAIDPSGGTFGSLIQPPSAFGDSSSLNVPGPPGQNAGSPGSNNGKPATSSPIVSSTPQTIQAGWREIAFPRPVPWGPVGPGPDPTPQIPAPAIPDAWRDAWAIFQLYPNLDERFHETSLMEQ